MPSGEPVRLAEMPDGAASAELAVERLEMMNVVRQSVVRQLQQLCGLYAEVALPPFELRAIRHSN
jgi:hypothetical protein